MKIETQIWDLNGNVTLGSVPWPEAEAVLKTAYLASKLTIEFKDRSKIVWKVVER